MLKQLKLSKRKYSRLYCKNEKIYAFLIQDLNISVLNLDDDTVTFLNNNKIRKIKDLMSYPYKDMVSTAYYYIKKDIGVTIKNIFYEKGYAKRIFIENNYFDVAFDDFKRKSNLQRFSPILMKNTQKEDNNLEYGNFESIENQSERVQEETALYSSNSIQENECKDDLIENLSLSVRAYNVLKKNGINYISQLEEIPINELQKMESMGTRSINDIIGRMKEKGIIMRKSENNVYNSESENSIEALNLSVRAYNVLKKNGINYISELKEISIKELQKMESMGTGSINDIIGRMKEKGIMMRKSENIVYNSESENSIDALNLSVRAYNALMKAECYYIENIIDMSKEEIYSIRNMGYKSANEVIETIEKRGYQFAPEKIDYLEDENIAGKAVKYNLIMIFRLLEKVFGTSVTRNFSDEKIEEFFCRMDNSLNTLKNNEKAILIERFGLEDGNPKTLESTAYKFGLTRERIRQIEKKSIKKLKDIRRTKILRTYISFKEKVDDRNMIDYILECALGKTQ